jgi:hypothetical protein
MRDLPGAKALIEQARRTLLEELMGALPRERRYPALMVANALAIAARELSGGEDLAAAEQDALADYLGWTGWGESAASYDAVVRRLAADIRAGKHDAEPALHKLLRDSATRRLRIANPKLLGE